MRDAQLLVLASLSDGPKHGYAMQTDIESFSGARLGPGTLYGAIGRLEETGAIELADDQGDRRRPYRITDRGRRLLAGRIVELQSVIARVSLT